MTPTIHNSAKKGEFAETVLMPGDPLRSKMIAETFLENYELVNNVRGIQGYTGYYKGKKVSVMACGMGNPTMGIYSYELFKFYGVKQIIRVGSIGAMQKNIKLRDIVLIERCLSNTNYNNFYTNNGEAYISCTPSLMKKAEACAKKLNMNYIKGNTLCSETFYSDEDEVAKAQANNLLGVEMETAALYINAQRLNKKAITIDTVSNNLITNEETTSEERQNSFKDMIKLALELA